MPTFSKYANSISRTGSAGGPRGGPIRGPNRFTRQPPALVVGNRILAGKSVDSGGAPFPNRLVLLLNSSNIVVDKQVTNGSADYSFTVSGNDFYSVVAPGADVAGSTLNNLQGV